MTDMHSIFEGSEVPVGHHSGGDGDRGAVEVLRPLDLAAQPGGLVTGVVEHPDLSLKIW